MTPVQVGAAPGMGVPFAAAQSVADRTAHVPGWPTMLDGTQHATGGWQPSQTLPVPDE